MKTVIINNQPVGKINHPPPQKKEQTFLLVTHVPVGHYRKLKLTQRRWHHFRFCENLM